MCWQKVRIIVLQVPPHPGCSRRAEQQRWGEARTGGSWWRVEGWLNWTKLNWGDDGKSMKLVPSSRQCAHQINKLPTCSFVRVGSRYTCCINCIQSEQHPCLEIVYTDTADNLTPRKHFILGHFNFIPQLNVAAMHYQNREADTRHGKVLVSSWSWHDKSLMWWKSKFCLVSGARLRARDGRRNTALTILPCCRSHRRWAEEE